MLEQVTTTNISEPLDSITDKSVTLRRALETAVHARHADALMLSGGVDSSMLAALDPSIPAYTTVLENHGEDLKHAQKITEYLGMQWYGIELSQSEAMANLDDLIWLTHSYDPALLNDIPLFVAMKHAANMGARTIRTGDFADSLFAGYKFLWEKEDLHEYLQTLLPHLTLASSRLLSAMDLHGHYPYLHPAVIDVALSLSRIDNIQEVETTIAGDTVETLENPLDLRSTHTWSKITLRRAALSLLPKSTVFRTKTDLEFGSGLYLLEKKLQSTVTPEQIEDYQNEGRRFWNRMHAALYARYELLDLKPTPPKEENEYACDWCGGGVIKGRHHCITCGAYPADKKPELLH